MKKYGAIPRGYMTVGELAKKMGTTVRTLQYYDKEGLLSPASESEGGRRLYTDKDMIRLHQIMSLKSLGFSLTDIKDRLISLESPVEVAEALAQQASAIREKLENLTESLTAIEALRKEVLQMQSVDFAKYADIIVNLQMKNEYYWLIKSFDDQMLDHIRTRFDMDSGMEMMETFKRLINRAERYQKNGVPPESEQGQRFAGEFWEMLTEFTGGDTKLLSELMAAESFTGPDAELEQKMTAANAFIGAALDVYFTALNYNPLEEGNGNHE